MARNEDAHPKVTVRPMLTTSQKNFRDVQHPSSILSPNSTLSPAITRDDLMVRGARCFLLHSLLSPEECQHYIKDTERIGYTDLLDLFPPEYRSNDRVLSICQPLVDTLWNRLQPHLTRSEVIRIRPIGFGNEGTWKPFRLNECCKFGKYKAGGHFSPHLDGPWVPHEDESSVFTVIIYLNSDFQGGETQFLDEEVACVVTPKQGTALVFNHDTLHEGLPVTEGIKYIIRTEIMYRRVDREMIPDPLQYQTNENYLTTFALYKKSWELEQAGDAEGFNDTYLEALKEQRRAQRSVGSDVIELHQQPLPYEIYIKIFCYLSPRDVCTIMTVSKLWYDMAMDGHLWYELYKQKWPIGIGLEAQLDHRSCLLANPSPPFIKDWYGLFKQRVKMDDPVKVMVVDLGSFSCKCAVVDRINSHIKTTTIESVVAMVPGVFDLHLRRAEWERYFCGKEAKTHFPNHLVNIIEKGIPVRAELLPEIITGFYYTCNVPPKFIPVVILEPPGLWNPKIRSEVAYTFVKMFMQQSVSFLSSAVATLCSVEMTSGVVVDVGHGIATCCAVWNGEERPGVISRDPLECTAPVLAKMVHSLVSSFTDQHMKDFFREHIVLTGGKAPKANVLETELHGIDYNYSVIEPRNTIYSSLGGGCMISSLFSFSKLQQLSTLKNMDYKPVKAMTFYNCVIKSYHFYWMNKFAEPEIYDDSEPDEEIDIETNVSEEDDKGAQGDEDKIVDDKAASEEGQENTEQDDEGELEEDDGSENSEGCIPTSVSEKCDVDERNETESIEKTMPTIILAGIKVPVIGLQVEAEETDPDGLSYYVNPINLGSHDNRTFMDKLM